MPVKAPSKAIACVPAPTGIDAVVRTGVSATPLFANIAEELLRTMAEAVRAVSPRQVHPEMAVAG